jgi:WD40 repeat protein
MQERGQDFHKNQVGGIILDSSNNILLTFSRNENLIKFWNYINGKIITTLSDHKGAIYGLSLDITRDSLISFSFTGEIIYWQYSKAQ